MSVRKYLTLWQKEGVNVKPAFVFVCGYIGTGKSTVSDYISKRLKYTNVVCTGVIRSIVRSLDDEHEDLKHHTYDFDYANSTLKQGQKIEDRIFEICLKQAEYISKCVSEIYKFSQTEKQIYIIDGAQIFPEFYSNEIKRNSLFIGAKADKQDYSRQVSGPNHKRDFTEQEIEILWKVHQKIVKHFEETSGLECIFTKDLKKESKKLLNNYLTKLIAVDNDNYQLINPQLLTVANNKASSL